MDYYTIGFDLVTWIAGGIVSFIVKLLMKRLDDLEAENADLRKDLNAHKLYAAETFTTKIDLEKMENTLLAYLQRIEDKLDRKVDK